MRADNNEAFRKERERERHTGYGGLCAGRSFGGRRRGAPGNIHAGEFSVKLSGYSVFLIDFFFFGGRFRGGMKMMDKFDRWGAGRYRLIYLQTSF